MTTQISHAGTPTEEQYSFITYLIRLLEDANKSLARAAMAHLRRGLGKPAGTAYEMDRYVLEQLPKGATEHDEYRYYLVASLFAFWHQGKDGAEVLDGRRDTERNLGRSLRVMIEREDPDNRENLEKSTEKRLNALLNSHRDDLHQHLRRITALLRSKDVPVNWAQLLHDVQHWGSENRYVQHSWAKGFWIQHKEPE